VNFSLSLTSLLLDSIAYDDFTDAFAALSPETIYDNSGLTFDEGDRVMTAFSEAYEALTKDYEEEVDSIGEAMEEVTSEPREGDQFLGLVLCGDEDLFRFDPKDDDGSDPGPGGPTFTIDPIDPGSTYLPGNVTFSGTTPEPVIPKPPKPRPLPPSGDLYDKLR